ncbi:MAG: S41 family peptidase [Clostridia bacterium]|nr:S41 family peptidase [Clostridia bacterium]
MDINENGTANVPMGNDLQSESKTTKYKKKKIPRKISLETAIVLILFAVLFTFQTTYVTLTAKYKLELNEAKNNVSELSMILEAYELFKENCIYDIDNENLFKYMMYSFSAEDKYSSYLTYEEFLDMYYESVGNASGIGIYINEIKEGLFVSHVMADSPAYNAGILAGDIIVAVKGQRISEVGYDEAVNLTAGNIGDQIDLTINRDGAELEITVTLGEYTPETVMYSVIEENGAKIGNIKILQFDMITVSQFKNAVEHLRAQGCEKLIFDVRDNPGGELDSIVDILDYLLPEGPIVRILDADKTETERYTSDKNEIDMPMAVLANKNTASAAELFTSALRDYEKAVIIGEKTYGKGCGQAAYRLSSGGYVWITSFYYNPPFGDNYDGEGIYPNIEVSLPEEYKNTHLFLVPYESDTQLRAAVAYLTK